MNVKMAGIGDSNYVNSFAIEMELETSSVDNIQILEEYESSIEQFKDQFTLIQYPDEDADTVSISIIGNLSFGYDIDPVFSLEYLYTIAAIFSDTGV